MALLLLVLIPRPRPPFCSASCPPAASPSAPPPPRRSQSLPLSWPPVALNVLVAAQAELLAMAPAGRAQKVGGTEAERDGHVTLTVSLASGHFRAQAVSERQCPRPAHDEQESGKHQNTLKRQHEQRCARALGLLKCRCLRVATRWQACGSGPLHKSAWGWLRRLTVISLSHPAQTCRSRQQSAGNVQAAHRHHDLL